MLVRLMQFVLKFFLSELDLADVLVLQSASFKFDVRQLGVHLALQHLVLSL